MASSVEIFLFADALGWEVVEANGFLKDLLPYRRRIGMQFGYSSAAIPTILSGQPPSAHKHLSLFRFAPAQSPFRWMRWLAPLLCPASFWNRGRIRHWLACLVGKLHGFTGYFQLYRMPFDRLPLMDYCEKKDLFVAGGMDGVENLCDLLSRSGRRFHISNWRLNDQRNIAEAQAALAKGAEFLFIYTAGLDAVLHQSPDPHSPPVREKLEWYRREIEGLWEGCRKIGKTPRLTVFSDHGMTPLKRIVDLKAAVEATGLTFGQDYGACYDSTMLRVDFLRPGAEAVIRNALKPFETCGHWLSEAEERGYGIYREDRYFGEAIFLLDPGVQIVPSDMGMEALPGMHGYAPEDKDSYAAILSNADIPPEVQCVADYFPMMRRRIEDGEREKAMPGERR